MKRSEKLLDAIGQIDDRLVEEAADAGIASAVIVIKKKKRRQKKAAIYRWQGALAACAVMAVCVGIFGLLTRSGILLSPFGAGSSQAPMEREEASMDYAAAKDAAMQEAAMEEKAEQGAIMEAAGEKDAGTDSAAAAGESDIIEDFSKAGAEKDTSETAKVTAEQQGIEQSDRSEDADSSWQSAERAESESMDMSGDVEITVTESSAESVTFIMEYKASDTICFGEEYALEQYAEGVWQTVRPKAEVCWKEPLYIVGDGGSFQQTVNFGTIYGALTPGHYRLVKHYERTSGKEPQGQETYPMYVEFTVAE